MNITGEWEGAYFYLDTDESGEPLPSNGFVMSLKQGDFGTLSGTVRDLPPEGRDETGRISGFYNEFNLNLVKVMPVMYVYEGNELSTFSESVEKHMGEPLQENPFLVVQYTGKWYDSEHAFRGSWEIPQTDYLLLSGKTFTANSSTGSWRMTRVELKELTIAFTEGKECQAANPMMSRSKS